MAAQSAVTPYMVLSLIILHFSMRAERLWRYAKSHKLGVSRALQASVSFQPGVLLLSEHGHTYQNLLVSRILCDMCPARVLGQVYSKCARSVLGSRSARSL